MTSRRRRRGALPARPRAAAADDRLESIGSCRVCGVCFVASTTRRSEAALLLDVHQQICPGGDRRGEVITPFT